MVERWIRRLLSRGRRLAGRPTRANYPLAQEDANRRRTITIYESELRAIAQDATSWPKETGGDLFGIWTEAPVIHLATKAGPNAAREAAHFRLDVDYLRDLSIELESDWGLRYFGDWHSHHNLGIVGPSAGDRARIVRLGSKNNFGRMAELIVCVGSRPPNSLDVFPYWYELPAAEPWSVGLIVLEGVSPIREALHARGSRAEQHWGLWREFPLEQVHINGEAYEHHAESPETASSVLVRHALRQVRLSLAAASNQSIEVHRAPFGHIMAVPTSGSALVAIAFDGRWPCRVLEVDWIDRSTAAANPLSLELDIDAKDPIRVVELYRAALRAAEMEPPKGGT